MKKEQLKKILKPLIRECIKEVLFEPGVLSTVIQEVMRGVGTSVITESAPAVAGSNVDITPDLEKQERLNEEIQRRKKKVDSTRKKLLDTIGTDSYNGVNLFEGTQPINKPGVPGEGAKPTSPLAHYAPDDPGVDISGLGLFKK